MLCLAVASQQPIKRLPFYTYFLLFPFPPFPLFASPIYVIDLGAESGHDEFVRETRIHVNELVIGTLPE